MTSTSLRTSRLPSPIFGLDSTTEVAPQWHHAVHSRFAARYTGHYTPKIITNGEYETYKRNDIGCAVVFEDAADNALRGYEQGKSDAEFAKKQTSDAGRPTDRPIYFAIDFDPSGRVGSLDSYFAGVAAVLGLHNSGPYGSYAACAHLMDRGFKWAWQTYAWSGGNVEHRAQLLQYSNSHTVGGVGVDYDQAWYQDYGQWNYKPPFVDVNHYDMFFPGPFPYHGKELRERDLVREYDKLRKFPRLHKHRLHIVRVELQDCADRIYDLASAHRKAGHTLPMEWSPFHRGERYKLLTRRASGQRVAA